MDRKDGICHRGTISTARTCTFQVGLTVCGACASANNVVVMALVTYVLLSTLLAGLRGQFQPELLGSTAFVAGLVVILEIAFLRLGCYFLSISNGSQLLDLVAYSGYKFVGVIVTVATAQIVNGGKGTGGLVGWGVFVYTYMANSLFLVGVNLCLPRFERF